MASVMADGENPGWRAARCRRQVRQWEAARSADDRPLLRPWLPPAPGPGPASARPVARRAPPFSPKQHGSADKGPGKSKAILHRPLRPFISHWATQGHSRPPAGLPQGEGCPVPAAPRPHPLQGHHWPQDHLSLENAFVRAVSRECGTHVSHPLLAPLCPQPFWRSKPREQGRVMPRLLLLTGRERHNQSMCVVGGGGGSRPLLPMASPVCARVCVCGAVGLAGDPFFRQ